MIKGKRAWEHQSIKAKHTNTANSWVDQAVELVDQIKQHFPDHWHQTKGKNRRNIRKVILYERLFGQNEHICEDIKEQAAYTLMTLLSLLHVTWNHVHGLTSVGSQLCKTLLGSCKFVLKLCKASPVSKHKNTLSGPVKIRIHLCIRSTPMIISNCNLKR